MGKKYYCPFNEIDGTKCHKNQMSARQGCKFTELLKIKANALKISFINDVEKICNRHRLWITKQWNKMKKTELKTMEYRKNSMEEEK